MSQPLDGHYARKRFGQNFLVSEHHIDAIIRAVNAQKNDDVIEIGPGLGAITKHLIPPLTQQLSIIEIDNDLAARLHDEHADNTQVKLINKDVLAVDFTQLAEELQPKSGFRVVGNLPYNISTPLLFHITEHLASVKDLHIMLQKEVAQRIIAEPNNKRYGRLSVMLQYFYHVEQCFDIPPEAFHPAPKVESSFIRLITRADSERYCDNEKLMGRLTKMAFQQRRKVIRKTLKEYVSELDIESLGLNPMARPEQLSVSDFVELTNFVHAQPAKVHNANHTTQTTQ